MFSFLSLFLIRKRKDVQFYFILMLLAYLFTFGSGSPVYMFAFHFVPGIKLLRAPSLMVFVGIFAAFALAGIFLRHLYANRDIALMRKSAYVFLAAAALCLIGAASPGIILGPWKALFYPEFGDNVIRQYTDNLPELQSGFLVSFLWFGIFGGGLLMSALKKFGSSCSSCCSYRSW